MSGCYRTLGDDLLTQVQVAKILENFNKFYPTENDPDL